MQGVSIWAVNVQWMLDSKCDVTTMASHACFICHALSMILSARVNFIFHVLFPVSCLFFSPLHGLRTSILLTTVMHTIVLACSSLFLTERWSGPPEERTKYQHRSACGCPEWQYGDSTVCPGLHATVFHCGT